uniref:Uncharacterized protein, isoform H n=1 Tax=Drosophila melanogaster TaxID=7227 RepID=A0A0B4K7R0_DROME|nr:uncharacterized protein Dmel_CG12963, isoform H [Drosophila melanogaster]AFH08097.1 uncharacterized protein Dmel_CG12963, isoform H [Drosophila melanogaster]|eukprot:NP_001246343.1 uncharacterized protein Dmel_CG12963, isoform H [Drosophila melanogaster]
MDFFIFYVGLFFIFFLIMPMVYFALQFILWIILNKCCGTNPRGFQDPVRRRRRRQRQRQRTDRNVFNAQEDPSSNRYGDIFFIEPGSVEANRIRDQLEKDEKDLPSYDEVMRMCNLTTPTAAAAGMPVPQSPLGVPSPIGIAALPAPPYSETDPHSSSAAEATVIAMEPMEPSTSRAAQIPPSSGSGPPAPLPTTAV